MLRNSVKEKVCANKFWRIHYKVVVRFARLVMVSVSWSYCTVGMENLKLELINHFLQAEESCSSN
jgi:hypothetical protein